jgi:tetratricopeptide (TPR) repeat protein
VSLKQSIKNHKIACLISSIVLILVIFVITNFAIKYQAYNVLLNQANEAMQEEKYDEAISLFGKLLEQKKNANIEQSLQLAKQMYEDQKIYNDATAMMQAHKYLDAIEQFSKSIQYKDSQIKRDECISLYVSDNIKKAQAEASSSNYDSAIKLLDESLQIDKNNAMVQDLKTSYLNSIKQQNEAEEKAKAEQIAKQAVANALSSSRITNRAQAESLVMEKVFHNDSGIMAESFSDGPIMYKGFLCYQIRGVVKADVENGGTGTIGLYAVEADTGRIWNLYTNQPYSTTY